MLPWRAYVERTLIELERRQPQLRRLTRDDWWAISRLLLTVCWAAVFAAAAAPSYSDVQDAAVTYLWVGLAATGALVAAVGRAMFQHLWVELPALLLLCGSWAAYAVLQLVVLVTESDLNRAGLFVLVTIVLHPQVERTSYLMGRLLVALGWRRDTVSIRRPGASA